MSLREEALALLDRWRATSAGQELLRGTYAAHLREHADALWRDGHPDHLTASALVLSADRRRVLLTHHRKAGTWFQLGGHLEPDDPSLAAAAAREAAEESGIAGLLVDPEPVHLDVHAVPFCRPDARHLDARHLDVRHLDVRFVMFAPDDALPVVSEESLAVRWWPVEDLPNQEPSLRELLAAALERVGQSGQN